MSENHPVRLLCKTGSFVLQRKWIPNAFVNFYKSNYFNGANERGRHKKMSQQYEFVTFFLATGRGGRLPAAFAGRRFRNDSFLLHADGACFVPAGDGQRGFAGSARFVGRVGHRDLAGTGRASRSSSRECRSASMRRGPIRSCAACLPVGRRSIGPSIRQSRGFSLRRRRIPLRTVRPGRRVLNRAVFSSLYLVVWRVTMG